MIVLRPAALVDLASVVALDRSVRAAPDQPTHAADWLEPDAESHIRNWIVAGECVVAETAGELAGYAVMHYHFFHSGLIDMVIVGQRFRRRGVGRSLVRHLAALCTSEKVWISTNLSNTPMQRLVDAEGFSMCGFIEGLDPGDPELIYSRPTGAAGR